MLMQCRPPDPGRRRVCILLNTIKFQIPAPDSNASFRKRHSPQVSNASNNDCARVFFPPGVATRCSGSYPFVPVGPTIDWFTILHAPFDSCSSSTVSYESPRMLPIGALFDSSSSSEEGSSGRWFSAIWTSGSGCSRAVGGSVKDGSSV